MLRELARFGLLSSPRRSRASISDETKHCRAFVTSIIGSSPRPRDLQRRTHIPCDPPRNPAILLPTLPVLKPNGFTKQLMCLLNSSFDAGPVEFCFSRPDKGPVVKHSSCSRTAPQRSICSRSAMSSPTTVACRIDTAITALTMLCRLPASLARRNANLDFAESPESLPSFGAEPRSCAGQYCHKARIAPEF